MIEVHNRKSAFDHVQYVRCKQWRILRANALSLIRTGPSLKRASPMNRESGSLSTVAASDAAAAAAAAAQPCSQAQALCNLTHLCPFADAATRSPTTTTRPHPYPHIHIDAAFTGRRRYSLDAPATLTAAVCAAHVRPSFSRPLVLSPVTTCPSAASRIGTNPPAPC